MFSKLSDIVMVAVVILVINNMVSITVISQYPKKEVLVEFKAERDSLYRSSSENRWSLRAKQMVGGWWD